MKIKINGIDKELTFADVEWQQVDSMPEDPPNSVPIMKQTPESVCFVLIYQIDGTMPFDKPQEVIDGIHGALQEDQGLIEVETINDKKRAIYSIVKTMMEENQLQYCLTLHFEYKGKFFNATGFFSPNGMTGTRETIIYEMARREGIVDEKGNGWCADPYDPKYKKGLLRNLSEDKNIDVKFPLNPLSECRKFANELIGQL